jgi:hypothetical protein
MAALRRSQLLVVPLAALAALVVLAAVVVRFNRER